MRQQLDTNRFLVPNGLRVDLESWDPAQNDGLSKRELKERTKALNDELEVLQELLWAEHKHRLLVVLQATDTGGKDGTIRNVFDGTNPQGVKVASFRKPTEDELRHDFLWRVHREVPGSGEITIFNRSHYEDVLVVRVHDIVPEQTWRARYGHINAFERLLVDEGTTIVKFFLHISKDEQKNRLQSRLDEPHKHWKFSIGDLAERERWRDYQAAFTEMLTETSQPHAPWYVVPADNKRYRNLVVSQILVETLQSLHMKYPEAEPGLDEIEIP